MEKRITGMDDLYGQLEQPDLVSETTQETVEEDVAPIIARLVELGYLLAEEVEDKGGSPPLSSR